MVPKALIVGTLHDDNVSLRKQMQDIVVLSKFLRGNLFFIGLFLDKLKTNWHGVSPLLSMSGLDVDRVQSEPQLRKHKNVGNPLNIAVNQKNRYKNTYLVGILAHEFYCSIQLGIIIIPTDFHSMIFQRGRSTTNQKTLLTIINHIITI